jgi:hypothetical protein
MKWLHREPVKGAKNEELRLGLLGQRQLHIDVKQVHMVRQAG